MWSGGAAKTFLSLFLLLQSNVRGEELIENLIRDGVVMINPLSANDPSTIKQAAFWFLL